MARHGVSQARLALAVGCTQPNIHQWMTEKRYLKAAQAADALSRATRAIAPDDWLTPCDLLGLGEPASGYNDQL
jgi:DNA-binding transcriptional regulator YdaS (Cro superfamily)